MPDFRHLSLFLAAALLLAITPGPGFFYVLARSLAGGRREGVLSSVGTFVGGLVHVFAAALGLSAVLATSVAAFIVLKYAGAAYLIYLGVGMIRSRQVHRSETVSTQTGNSSIRQGIWTEILNPKTALFFLAFIPQFVSSSRGHLFMQFAVLGITSVALNTLADLTIAFFAGSISERFNRNPRLQKRQQVVSGAGMIALGLYVGFSGTARAK